jgi:5-methylcytosine-specific restriction protein A
MPAGAGPRERLVWQRFADQPAELHAVAQAIAREAVTVTPAEIAAAADDGSDDVAFPEGRVLLSVHRRHERRGARRKKRQVLSATGRLACEACGFDFASAYGELGEGFAECHHTRPLAEGPRKTRLADLAVVCSNCHRMIHRRSPLLTVCELRELLALQGQERPGNAPA